MQLFRQSVQFLGKAVKSWRRLVGGRRVHRRARSDHVAVRPAADHGQVAADSRRRGRALDERQEEMSVKIIRHVCWVEIDVHETAKTIIVDRLQTHTIWVYDGQKLSKKLSTKSLTN